MPVTQRDDPSPPSSEPETSDGSPTTRPNRPNHPPATVEDVSTSTSRPTHPDGPTATASSSSTSTLLPPTAVPSLCAPSSEYLVTPSGRRVLLRAAGVRPRSPLVLILHGYTGTPAGIERVAEFSVLGNAASIAVAYPEGTPTPTEGYGWASGAGVFATGFVDDVAALLEMIDTLGATGCVDPTRVVLAGESNGAGMALATACDPRSAGRLAAVVMVNAAIDEGVMARCAAGAPLALPLSAVAGEIDQTVPYEGGRGLLGQERWWTEASWILAGCEVTVPATQLDDWAQATSGSRCETCSELFTVADGTHTWPGTSRGTGGLRPGTFDLNSRLLWIAASPPPAGCLPW